MKTKTKKKVIVSKKLITVLPEHMEIKLDGISKRVLTEDFIRAKTGDLREFGYNDLTEDEVRVQLLKIANQQELDIIGMFVERNVHKI